MNQSLSFSNFSNYTDYFDSGLLASTGNVRYSYLDVIRDHAQQIDQKIVLFITFILFFWIMIYLVAPISKKGFKGNKYISEDLINLIYNKFISLTETFALGSSVLIVIYAIIQYGYKGLNTFTKFMIVTCLTLTALILITMIIKFIKWLFGRKKKEVV